MMLERSGHCQWKRMLVFLSPLTFQVQANGGIMTLEDLASYYPSQDTPLRVNFSNMDVYAPPVPSGGPDLLFALNVMELLGLSPESAYRNLTYQHLVEVSWVHLFEPTVLDWKGWLATNKWCL